MSQDFPFNINATGFDISNAYSLAKVSQLVYTPFEKDEETRLKVINQAKEWGLNQIYLFDYNSAGEDSQGLILANSEQIILAFRGTETSKIQDVITDLKISQIPRLNGKVHRGFYVAFSTLWVSKLTIWKFDQEITDNPGIKEILTKLLTTKKRPIFVTGHSLGGAMAVLGGAACGLELKEAFQPEITVYTYGQPRVGNDNFNNTLTSNIKGLFRVVNNNDIVARIPVDLVKKTPALDYSHTGKLVYLDTNKKVHLQDLGWWAKTKDEFWGRIQDIGKPGTDGIKDHDLGKYVAILKGALDQPQNII
jgi:predicted lipase